ncbi:Uncharacterized protein HZ326_6109 [Fusarium oxysporum f. sp. albedinis]|nr:Uncharacterized protein HZ326_6109 [Fusarium oxysporum f. sp. albedinis]
MRPPSLYRLHLTSNRLMMSLKWECYSMTHRNGGELLDMAAYSQLNSLALLSTIHLCTYLMEHVWSRGQLQLPVARVNLT